MATNDTVKIRIKVDADTGELLVTKNNLEEIGKVADKSAAKIDGFKDTMLGVGAGVIGVLSIKAALESVYDAATELISVSSKFENFNAVMQTISTSAEEAQKSFAWLTEFTTHTHYTLDETTEAFIRLKSYGLDAMNGLMQTLGDTASAMGKNLLEAVEAIADATTGEFERLKEFGIKSFQQGNKVAFQWADTMGKIHHIIVDKNQKIIESTLKAIWNSKYQGAMERASRTLTGIMSNISDTWKRFKVKLLSGGLYRYVKAVARAYLDYLQMFTNKAVQHVDTVNKAIMNWADNTIIALGYVAHAWNGIRASYNATKVAFYGVVNYTLTGIETIYNGYKMLKVKVHNLMATMVNGLAKMFHDGFVKIADYINDLLEKIANSTQKLFDFMHVSNPFRAMKIQIDEFKPAIDEVTYKYEKLFNTDWSASHLKEALKDLNDAVNDVASESAINTAKDVVKRIHKYYDEFGKQIKTTSKETVKGALDGAFKGFNESATKHAKKVKKIAKKAATDAGLTMVKAFDDTFFNLITGKIRSLGEFFKSIFAGVGNNIARSISNSLTQSLFGKGLTATALGTAKAVAGQTSIGGVQLPTGGSIGGLGNLGSVMNFIKSPLTSIANGINQIGGALSHIPYIGGTLGNVANGASALLTGGNPASFGMAGSLGAIGLGAGLGYLGGSLLDKLFGAETHAATGGSIGAAIGTAIMPGIGTLIGGALGSLVGGLFGKKKMVGKDTGIDIFGTATADNVSGREWLVQHWVKKSWFSKKKWDKWFFSAFNKGQIEAIKKVIGQFDNLLDLIGFTGKKLRVAGGRFKSIESFLNGNVVKAFLKEVMNLGDLTRTETYTKQINKWATAFNHVLANRFIKTSVKATRTVLTDDGRLLNDVYNAWVRYAKSVNKKVYEAFTEVVGGMVDFKRSFKSWIYQFTGDTLGLARYQYQIALEDLNRIKDQLGVTDVTVSNFLEKYDEAIKKHFTPETIKQWQLLGQALQRATEAGRQLQGVTNGLYDGRRDMLLRYQVNAQKVDIDKVAETIREGNSKSYTLFYEILKAIKEQTNVQRGLSQ